LFKAKLFISILLTAFALWLPPAVFASTTDGTLDGYAWSSKIGWINFGVAGGNGHITDFVLTGYAWSDQIGWINLNPTNSGVKNNGKGDLSGKAWAQGFGWVDFENVAVSDVGVFSGTASGDNNITIDFSCYYRCHVSTDWRSETVRPTLGGAVREYGSPRGPFDALINEGSQYTSSSAVELSLIGGIDASKVVVSNSSDFSEAVPQDYQKTKQWILPQGDGQKTVYIKFLTSYNTESQVLSRNIILDTKPPEIKITNRKEIYGADEEVIIGGTTESNVKIILVLDVSKEGFIRADQEGNWVINLGQLSLGLHSLFLTAQDLAGNKSKAITVNLLVQEKLAVPEPDVTLAPPLPPIVRQLEKAIGFFVPKIFQPREKPFPRVVITVPKLAPLALSGSLPLVSTLTLGRLVLTPLPSDIKLLAQKFPQVSKVLAEVGVKKFPDIFKLENAKLKLPTLTEAVLQKEGITGQKIAVLKGIPVEAFSATAKTRFPSEIVFAKAGNGLIDFDIALSLNQQGRIEQKIETVVGSPLQLVVKTDQPVKSVRGYIVFKSKKPGQSSFKVPLNELTNSPLFVYPYFLAPAALSNQLVVENDYQKPPLLPSQTIQLNESETKNGEGVQPVETRLVLADFEYQPKGEGVYVADIRSPLVDGEYEIITLIDYADASETKEIILITVVDPEGYIYEMDGDLQTRVAGAIVSLYWLNPELKQYELWPSKDFQQENPQTTDVRGTYSFLVPNGFYYLKVDAPGYLSYDGRPFEVREGRGIHINIELKTKYWLLRIFDWKTFLLIVIILMIGYNFYRDKMREKKSSESIGQSSGGSGF